MTRFCIIRNFAVVVLTGVALSNPIHAADPPAAAQGAVEVEKQYDTQELARQLANPVAALISVPFQLNYDTNIGPADDGDRWILNFQPVLPISLNDNWNMISRTIVPLVAQDEIFPGAGNQSGIGDIVQSLWLSPQKPTSNGWIWGVGPVFLFPSGSDDLLTTGKWGAGPTAVALRQSGPWTFGGLFNHVWSYAGEDDRVDINSTFMQPFLTYNRVGGGVTPAASHTTGQTVPYHGGSLR